ncbi:MAG: DUF1700 domain-containing protein [Oscillospiraceae bacterium]|nr:DUF1700 domain-containing protein [Oscillospiraceae bacterium]
MNKETFMSELRNALSGLPRDDAEERLAFYGEMIDDRMEEGLSEEEAVAGAGSVDGIAAQIVAEIPLGRIVKEKMAPKRALKAWEIVLIVLGFPLWLPLLIAAGAIILSLYIVVWALIVSLWAIEVSLWACALGGAAAGLYSALRGKLFAGAAAFGAGLVCAGASVFLFFGCVSASKGLILLTGKAAVGVKRRILGKERKAK